MLLDIYYTPIVWHWWNNTIFVQYFDSDNWTIQEAYEKNNIKSQLSINNELHIIDFNTMTQTNCISQIQVPIARYPTANKLNPVVAPIPGPILPPSNPNPPTTPYIWQWQSDNGYVSYNSTDNDTIEKDYQAMLQNSKILINGANYMINFATSDRKSVV